MDLLTAIGKFENSNMERCVVSSKNDGNILSYAGTVTSITINEKVFTNIIRVCFKSTDTTIKLYVNHSKKTNLTKFDISSISTLVIT